MIIGVPREIKDNENRVGITPAGVEALVKAGHRVVIEKEAGLGSGITDEEFIAAGAEMLPAKAEVYARADMIMKVKEPLPEEYDLFKEGQLLFTYLHLAPEPELTRALLVKKIAGVAYETIQTNRGTLPLLVPMSEVAGRMSIQIGAQFLEKPYGGRGVLLGGVPGVPPAKVVIVGGGTVGTNAAKVAVGMGAEVTIIDKNAERLAYLDDIFGARVKTLMSSSYGIKEAVKDADLVIGAVLIPGARTPKLVTEDMVKNMQPGAVIVDVAIDQGGCVETADRVTTHSHPTYVKYGVIHYAVANIPGAVARTSTFALTNATLPYALALADKGLARAVKEDIALARGVNVYDGKVTYKAVAEALNLEYTPLHEVMDVPVDLMRVAS
ncbi:alanine dehydrogenase [Desulfofundulus thermobenzoicus]|uniref:Alanine dehydrogenase n=1 Tax=Desulfofundulus thermobenzoicus TaxID=29376 RepID=A0A6N7IML3_9FIRM|nr:alanine dehydrogenase [Desulfofundulus thermobenzoicus]MQL51191.1 alanine dehydrogenase [Desulfofundulus thermobenzoicus]